MMQTEVLAKPVKDAVVLTLFVRSIRVFGTEHLCQYYIHDNKDATSGKHTGTELGAPSRSVSIAGETLVGVPLLAVLEEISFVIVAVLGGVLDLLVPSLQNYTVSVGNPALLTMVVTSTSHGVTR